MNDFKECLEQSHKASDLPFWVECYVSFFPNLIGMHDHRQDGQHQRQGIDRSIVLENGKVVWVDEKVRGRNRVTGKVYRDIALEEWSKEDRDPGWAVKPLLCDYIAYAIAPLGKCYLLPVQQLQQAWLLQGEIWKTQHPKIKARNHGYITISWGIPVPILFGAMGDCLRAHFAACEFIDL